MIEVFRDRERVQDFLLGSSRIGPGRETEFKHKIENAVQDKAPTFWLQSQMY